MGPDTCIFLWGSLEDALAELPVTFIHPCALSFAKSATALDFVDHSKVVKIAAEICSDGFVSSGDELKCFQRSDLEVPGLEMTEDLSHHEQKMYFFSMGYVKGFSRSCTLLLLLDIILSDFPGQPITDIMSKLVNASSIAIRVLGGSNETQKVTPHPEGPQGVQLEEPPGGATPCHTQSSNTHPGISGGAPGGGGDTITWFACVQFYSPPGGWLYIHPQPLPAHKHSGADQGPGLPNSHF